MGKFLELLRKEANRSDLEFWITELQEQAYERPWGKIKIKESTDEELFAEIERLETYEDDADEIS